MKKNEEEPGGEREKKRSERERGRICPEEKSHQARYTGITPLVRSARGSGEIPGPGPDERIYREVQDASTPTYDGPSNDILLARLVTPHLPACCLSLPFLLLPACRPPCFFLSFFLSFSRSALSRSTFPRGWIAARGYVRNCGTKSASAEELTVHRGGHKTLLILIDFVSLS